MALPVEAEGALSRSPHGGLLATSALSIERCILALIILTAAGLGFAGIKKNLPFTPEVDEGIFVRRAVDIVATGDLNPGWFGHPGSTVIYPLAGAYGAWHAVTDGGSIVPPERDIRQNYDADTDDYYYIGRSLTILYFVGAVFLTYLIGRRAFSPTVGLIAALFIAVNPLTIEHAQIVRTDTAGAFFGLLSFWLILRLHHRPGPANRILAGAGIGLAVSSRYFLVVLLPVLALVELLILLGLHSSRERSIRVPDLAAVLVGPAAALAAFALTSPYFLLDFGTARESIQAENRATHLGADGLSRPENLWWYLTDAIPGAVTVPVALLALVGGVIAGLSRRQPQLLCLAMLVVFLLGISYSALHWQRWLIPMLPFVAILAALAIHEGVAYARERLRWPGRAATAALFAIGGILIIWPASDVILHDVRAASPSTNVAARNWIVENLPSGSRIAGELYTAPLQGTDFAYSQEFSLFERHTLDDYRARGVTYIVASSGIYDRYYAEPERYAGIIQRYDTLFGTELLNEFRPGDTRGGPTIRVYKIGPPD